MIEIWTRRSGMSNYPVLVRIQMNIVRRQIIQIEWELNRMKNSTWTVDVVISVSDFNSLHT